MTPKWNTSRIMMNPHTWEYKGTHEDVDVYEGHHDDPFRSRFLYVYGRTWAGEILPHNPLFFKECASQKDMRHITKHFESLKAFANLLS